MNDAKRERFKYIVAAGLVLQTMVPAHWATMVGQAVNIVWLWHL